MSDWLKVVLDPYDRRARVAPALCSGAPLLASGALLFPGVGSTWSLLGGLAAYCCLSMVLIQVGRGRGKSLEPGLFEAWGGKPSVAMLRHRDRRLNAAAKERYRGFLNGAVPGLTLPSPEEELRDPEKADEAYDSANLWLLEQTRDHGRFGLVFAENMNYGFRRNLWALKPWAFTGTALASAVAAVAMVIGWEGRVEATLASIGAGWWLSVGVVAVHALWFAIKVRPGWVLAVAVEYAKRLLGACDTLDDRKSVK